MRADTQTVVDFLGDPRNLPRWAVGFAKSVKQDGDRWIVETGSGEVPIRIVTDRRLGVVDFHMSLGPGKKAVAASRSHPDYAAPEDVLKGVRAALGGGRSQVLG